MNTAATLRTVDAVVFDVGNVLIRWDPMNLYRKIFADEAEARAFLVETDLHALNVRFDAGLPFATGLAEAIARMPHHRAALEAYDLRWAETVAGVIEENVTLLTDLKRAGVPVHAISNFSREKFDVARGLLPFLDSFDVTILSGDIGVNKPDPGIYHALLARVATPAGRMIFIDDMPHNIAAAAKAGFQTFHFPEPTPARAALFRTRLREAGLPV